MYDILERVMGRSSASKFGRYVPQSYNNNFVMEFDSKMKNEDCERLYPDFNIDKSVRKKLEYVDSLSGSSMEKMRLVFFREELVSLLERQNKVCMANSVENRVPFLDNKFVELMFATSENQLAHLQVRNLFKNTGRKIPHIYEDKYILKQMSANIYGGRFAYRKKQAVRVPLERYIKNPHFQKYLHELIIPEMKSRGMIDMREFEKAYKNLDESDNTSIVWAAINMEAWMQLFYDGRKAVSM
jgi:asparagine synthetase B (glutamine-hydrolysing)